MDVPLELPMLWNWLVQPHIWKFHRGEELLCLHTRKLSSDSFERQTFLDRLQILHHQIFVSPWHVSTRESSPGSFISIVERTLLHAKPLSSSQPNSFFIFERDRQFLSRQLRATGHPLITSSSCPGLILWLLLLSTR